MARTCSIILSGAQLFLVLGTLFQPATNVRELLLPGLGRAWRVVFVRGSQIQMMRTVWQNDRRHFRPEVLQEPSTVPWIQQSVAKYDATPTLSKRFCGICRCPAKISPRPIGVRHDIPPLLAVARQSVHVPFVWTSLLQSINAQNRSQDFGNNGSIGPITQTISKQNGSDGASAPCKKVIIYVN